MKSERLEEILQVIKQHKKNKNEQINIKEILQELQMYKDGEMIPAFKFKNSPIEKQILKIKDEIKEMETAYHNNDIVNFLEEIADVQIACETLLLIIGLNKAMRMSLRKSNNIKNKKRGYHNYE